MKHHLLFLVRSPAVAIPVLFLFVFICGNASGQDTVAIVKHHTVSSHVQVMDTAFFMPQLDRTRRIWIYLPEGYAHLTKRYPVLYMHNGQSIFDEQPTGFDEWGVDESLDSLIIKGQPACIVVGIDDGLDMFTEYNPYNNENFGNGEGDKYMDFLVHTLKPFIDGHYKSLPSKENTLIAGSGMGGLISYYAMLKYPDVFAKAGIFSPAFAPAPAIKQLTDSLAKKMTGKFFFYIGDQEGRTYPVDINELTDKLATNSNSMIYSVVDPEAGDNERAWRKWFVEFYCWMMADGFNPIHPR